MSIDCLMIDFSYFLFFIQLEQKVLFKIEKNIRGTLNKSYFTRTVQLIDQLVYSIFRFFLIHINVMKL